MTDQLPSVTASEADAGRFPRLARPSRAAVVAAAGIVGVLVLGHLVGEVLAIFLIGLILALPVAAAARDVYAYVFRRAAGLEPNPSLPAAPVASSEA